ncbi:N-acetylmuramidase domain-containing protein [Desertibaculum subflavum]|uniref:N-acetylmuramidase domain-containing protein n=1 Tax=Desertibaculum subflavum TaxID=2268458 RepID=UPI000E660C2F
MPIEFQGRGRPLTQSGFHAATAALDVTPAALWALITVETRGFGYLPDRRPKILFERHIFHRRTGGRFDATAPDLSSPDAGGYSGDAAEYDRLARAIRLDRKAALESASWGLPQIMGFNAESIGYASAEAMVQAFLDSEDAQLDGAVRFLTANTALAKAFRAHDWATVARHYNGKDFAKNKYDIKLRDSHDRYAAGAAPDLAIRAAQARLTYLAVDPRGVDGVLGNGTRGALRAFQKAQGLPVTGEPDEATLARLEALAD